MHKKIIKMRNFSIFQASLFAYIIFLLYFCSQNRLLVPILYV